jgi:hypothetical protein
MVNQSTAAPRERFHVFFAGEALLEAAGFVEVEARVARVELRGIAIAYVDEQDGLPLAIREGIQEMAGVEPRHVSKAAAAAFGEWPLSMASRVQTGA